jgi:hypothetical protein
MKYFCFFLMLVLVSFCTATLNNDVMEEKERFLYRRADSIRISFKTYKSFQPIDGDIYCWGPDYCFNYSDQIDTLHILANNNEIVKFDSLALRRRIYHEADDFNYKVMDYTTTVSDSCIKVSYLLYNVSSSDFVLRLNDFNAPLSFYVVYKVKDVNTRSRILFDSICNSLTCKIIGRKPSTPAGPNLN